MGIIQCKMCGGNIELSNDKTFGTCEYCGNTTTFPKIDDEQRAAAFNRGNHFRRIGEFDKALAVYERIVQENNDDAEAHWCCALCRFGIEYVEDPGTYEWLPTCHRASFDSFLEDVDYLAALDCSDGVTRQQYKKDAAKIADVQRGILATSQNEEPFDVFICYKESDDSGNRTVDSTLAQDIYYQLTEQGRRVFFARITLEDKAGSQYEPYIFAALHSAKVMIAVGTKQEYFNAVWVKNEWSRFLALMKKDHKKLLLPCYRDMDPYDLPEQLSPLQSYDMGKIGFIQDLIRGVAKVLDADKKVDAKEAAIIQNDGRGNLTALLKRGNFALEDGDWEKADDFYEQALNLDAECAEAYLGKALAAEHCVSIEAFTKAQQEIPKNIKLVDCIEDAERIDAIVAKYQIPNYLDEAHIKRLIKGKQTVDFDKSYSSIDTDMICKILDEKHNYFQNDKFFSRALRYADSDLAIILKSTEQSVCDYLQKVIDKSKEENEENIQRIKREHMAFYDVIEEEMDEHYKYAVQRREADYVKAHKNMEKAEMSYEFKEAAMLFNKVGIYKDSQELAEKCRKKGEDMSIHYNSQANKKDVLGPIIENIIYAILVIIIVASIIWIFRILTHNDNYYIGYGKISDWTNVATVYEGDSSMVGLKADKIVV